MTDKLASLAMPDGRRSEAALETPAPRRPRWRPFAARKGAAPPRAGMPSSGGGDWIVVLAGIGLAMLCALFPWYIFFNQEEFGIRPLQFAGRLGNGSGTGAAPTTLPELTGMRLPSQSVEEPPLDAIATGALADAPESAPAQQPFPGERIDFRLVHAANGRAMIEDADGYWIVQRGSVLPDGSRVAAIERREGAWALVTSHGTTVPLAEQ